MKNSFYAMLSVVTAVANYARAARGNASAANTIPFFDAIEQCWKTIRQNIVIRDTTPLGQGSGLLTWLLSATNMNATDARMSLDASGALSSADGKDYKIRRKWFPKQYSGDLSNHPIAYCNTGTGCKQADIVDEVTIRNVHTSAPCTFDKADIRCREEGWESFLSKRLDEQLRLHEVALAKKVAALVASGNKHDGQPYIGAFPGENIAGMIKPWPIMKADGETVNTAGLAWFKEIFENMELNGRNPMVIGGPFFSMLTKKLEFENCGTCSGVDAAAVRTDIEGMFLRDTEIGTRMGNKNAVLALMPGALKLVTRARFKGDFAENDPNHRRFTVISPRTGIEHDILWNRECGKEYKYSYQYTTEYDVIGYPACWTQDPCLKGVTDVLGFLPVCADTPLCDLEVPGCNVVGAPVETIDRGDCVDNLLLTCLNPCSASFTSTTATKCFHTVLAAVGFNVIDINGVEFGLSQTYDDLTDPAQVAALTADLNVRLPLGSKVVVLDDAQIVLDVPCAVTSIDLKLDSAVLFTFVKEQLDVVCYTAHVAPTTGGVITEIQWTMPDGTPIVGVPGDVLAIPGYTGTIESFCVDIDLAGDPGSETTLTVRDSKACEKIYTGENFDCPPGEIPPAPGVAEDCDYLTQVQFGGLVDSLTVDTVVYPIGLPATSGAEIQAAVIATLDSIPVVYTAVAVNDATGEISITGSAGVVSEIIVGGLSALFVQSNCI